MIEEQEVIMRQAFWQQASQAVEKTPRGLPSPQVDNAGAEIELFLFRPDGTLATNIQKNQVLKALERKISAGVELGAAAIELHPPPVSLRDQGFSGWLRQLQAEQSFLIEASKDQGFLVGRHGTVPWVDFADAKRTTDVVKYCQVPDFHDTHQTNLFQRKLGPVSLPSASSVGLISAFQFTLEATTLEDGIDKMNRLFMLSPLAVALGANARFVGEKDTTWADCRMQTWRKTHETRTLEEIREGKTLRIGLPKEYYPGPQEYFEDIASRPFILDKPDIALLVGTGLLWRDARLKFFDQSCGVEFRSLAIQPTVEEDIAMAVFKIGRLLHSQQVNESFLPMSIVQRNKLAAEKNGLNAIFETSTGQISVLELLQQDVRLSRSALCRVGLLDCVAEESFAILRERLAKRQTPSERLVGLTKSQMIESVTIK